MPPGSVAAQLLSLRREHVALCRDFYLERLVPYAESPGFARRLEDEVEACLGPVGEVFGVGNSGDPEQDAYWLAIDSLLFHREESAIPVAQRLLKFDKQLGDAQRGLLAEWIGDVPHDFFEVARQHDGCWTLRSLESGDTFDEVYSLFDEPPAVPMGRGAIVFARLLPCSGAWLSSRPLERFPDDEAREIRARVAARG